MTLLERLNSTGPKRILALDGGGIRGALTLGFLEKIELILRERHKKPTLKLCDYFDLIGGTSTGSIIASFLAIGKDVADIKNIYLELGGKVFGKKKWKKWEALFDIKPLEEELKKEFKDLKLGDPSIKTGLCIVTKRADTGSTWPLINHPNGMYYQANSPILLRNAIRASAAAPVYFVPEKFDVGAGQVGAFVDGGVSMANNPALQLFLVATLQGFPFRWATGANQLLLVSVGTGTWERSRGIDEVAEGKVWNWATEVPSMLMDDASAQNQLLLQCLSSTPTPWAIDQEVGDGSADLLTTEPILSYLRYNVRLEEDALNELGLGRMTSNMNSLREMSAAQNRHDLALIGEVAAKRQVKEDHFPSAFDIS